MFDQDQDGCGTVEEVKTYIAADHDKSPARQCTHDNDIHLMHVAEKFMDALLVSGKFLVPTAVKTSLVISVFNNYRRISL